ncbi:hypothetical protein DSOUD_0557 [Desulfuromonas soudanensis]|uniref:PilZ domain-containing protein n=1 Tax=Desulfuromonas soudanensis TaxID=1603606 RepID=A0A0M4CZB9_9BACT|nr:PilZ domain-containing protein [Desulfuromonas soudanensis]ALC15346.1 hypothetical protein DSOUD_0557 [Desulfuromonas soudanensis]
MLFDRTDEAPEKRRIALRIDGRGLQAVLGAILREWRYEVVVDGPCELILADEGAGTPAGDGPVLRLGTPGPLSFPLSLEALWQALESRFHLRPRRHLRITLPQDIEVRQGRLRQVSSLVSLSPRGGRFAYPREVARGEEVELRLPIGEADLTLGARVIYAVPLGEWQSGPDYNVGVVFDRQEEKQKTLQAFIARSYLERVRLAVDEDLFCAGAVFFQTPGEGNREG